MDQTSKQAPEEVEEALSARAGGGGILMKVEETLDGMMRQRRIGRLGNYGMPSRRLELLVGQARNFRLRN